MNTNDLKYVNLKTPLTSTELRGINTFTSDTKEFICSHTGDPEKTLFVHPDSTGSVEHQTLDMSSGSDVWVTVATYGAGEGDVLVQGQNIFRFVPSDETTRYKFL
jgi:hypothetical protein